jgi:ATP-binding cassette subfamily B protein
MIRNYKNIFKLKKYIKKCRIIFYGAIFIMLIGAVIYMPIPYLMGTVLDKVLVSRGSIAYFGLIA